MRVANKPSLKWFPYSQKSYEDYIVGCEAPPSLAYIKQIKNFMKKK